MKCKEDKLSKEKKLKEKEEKLRLKQEAENKKLKFEETVRKVSEKYSNRIGEFSQEHFVYPFCFPNGIRYNSKKELKSVAYKQHVYVCNSICENKCDFFTRKMYACSDIGCANYPICLSKNKKGMNEFCEKKGLAERRKSVLLLYDNFFHDYAVFRGLKLDPEKTIRYLKQQILLKKKNSNSKDKKGNKKNAG